MWQFLFLLTRPETIYVCFALSLRNWMICGQIQQLWIIHIQRADSWTAFRFKIIIIAYICIYYSLFELAVTSSRGMIHSIWFINKLVKCRNEFAMEHNERLVNGFSFRVMEGTAYTYLDVCKIDRKKKFGDETKQWMFVQLFLNNFFFLSWRNWVLFGAQLFFWTIFFYIIQTFFLQFRMWVR